MARSSGKTLLAGLFGLILAGCSAPPSPAEPSAQPTRWMPSSPSLLENGRKVFEKECAPCHGIRGDGQGEAAYLLYPKPRDFVAARYRIVSTRGYGPTDEDLFRTISRGMPGSAMPSWAHLPESTRWGLVHYIKSLAREPLEAGSEERLRRGEAPQVALIQPPPEPEDTAESRQRGRALFLENCASCHGVLGRGDGRQHQVDVEGFPTRPRDLTAGIYKGSPDPDSLYRRILAGLPGSPMPSYDFLSEEQVWDLVHYIRSLSSEAQRARSEMRRFRIVAARTSQLPDHPDASVWRQAPAVNLHLMPLWWRDDRPEEVSVQALHDGRVLAIQLTWADTTHDHTALRPQDFRDAAAIQLSADPDPPFFGMGERGRPVEIWMWKSERQTDLEPAFQDLDKIYPNLGIDSYPNLLRSPLEQPTRHALTLEADPTFVTGWGAGNIVSDPTPRTPSEELAAEGFGTLRALPRANPLVSAVGVYSTGSYRVVFTRPLQTEGSGVSVSVGQTVPVGFAVWDGHAGDRDGKKSVTIWQELFISPEPHGSQGGTP